ncbi:MAG TPA: hypothetical protein VGK37_05630 [Casimicrobiaceae bacterium]|jgi:hypothetical protein
MTRSIGVSLAAMLLALGVVACDRTPDKSAAAAKPELTPTTPAIGAPPANPPPIMPPPASAALENSAANPAPQPPGTTPVDARPPADQTANGSDPSAKQPMKAGEESTAMPKPAQANDHSTLATDGKQ